MARVVRELHAIYHDDGTLTDDERHQVKGGMAALALILETATRDYKKLLEHAAHAGNTEEERNYNDARTIFSEN